MQPHQVQRLVAGCDFDAGRHLVLEVLDPGAARRFLARQLTNGRITFADADHGTTRQHGVVGVGFTYGGLERLGVAGDVLDALAEREPPFREGAAARAERWLGDTGVSAPSHWDAMFATVRAHVVLDIRADDAVQVKQIADGLASARDAQTGFAGWDSAIVDTKHLTSHRDAHGRKVRTVHFGFRDDVARPRVYGLGKGVAGAPLHAAGELLLGFENDAGFDRYCGVSAKTADLLRHGSFAVVRRIEQDEAHFRRWLDRQVQQLERIGLRFADAEYLKAKLCGRWANGARIRPGQTRMPGDDAVDDGFDFADDRTGYGCPFGAHIRRTNPRADPVVPPRPRVLFRRGMPYGPKYEGQGHADGAERGLLGVFCGGSIQDQFEFVIGQWVEANPIGAPLQGSAKDPLIGHHDDPGERFHVPLPNSPGLWLDGFEPFVRTRGTLYTLLPSRAALEAISGIERAPVRSSAGAAAPAPPEAASGGASHVVNGGEASASARYCDLVMEGGVTSGIVYAGAVHRLARVYRFHAIGGTSVGAFAAALTAAAEFRRRVSIGKGGCDDGGFVALGELPQALGKQVDGGPTLLERLFRPQPETRRPFAVVHSALGHASTGAAVLAAARRAVVEYRWHALAWFTGFLLLALAGPLALVCGGDCSAASAQWVWPEVWLPALLVTVAFAVVVATLAGVMGGIVTDLRHRVSANGFGLCRGWSNDEQPLDADLTGFMHATIQRLAGRTLDAPLTFGDLWRAPGGPPLATGRDPARYRSIDLVLYATNLSHGRPVIFPNDERTDDMGRLFFRPEELAPYFPPQVLRHLLMHARPYVSLARHDPEAGAAWEGILELPVEHLPIVVAARISMGFPLLLSAVPLYAIDYEAQSREHRLPRRCWLSDGGLCTNFPIHLFDAFVPRWPTFGIAVQRRRPGDPRRVWLPAKHYQGRGDTWLDDIDARSPTRRLGAFVWGLWRAASTWGDMTLLRMPAVRDRVVRVLLDDGEGGVNIRMSPPEIERLAEYGEQAARELIAKFAPPDGPGWAEHRWVRFNRLVATLRDEIVGLADAVRAHGGAPSLVDQLWTSMREPALRGAGKATRHADLDPSEATLSPAQALELRMLLQHLLDLEAKLQALGGVDPSSSLKPRPQLRIRPPV